MEEELKRLQHSQSNMIFYFMLTIGTVSSVTILLINIFRWVLMDTLTPFIAPFIEIIGYIVFCLSTLVVFVYFVVSKPSRRARNGIPFLLNIIILILVLVVPINSIVLNFDFRSSQHKREKVVDMVMAGGLLPNVFHNPTLIRLPDDYKELSKGGGEIVVLGDGTDTQILFFTYRGVTDQFAGFVYSADGQEPDENRFGKWVEVKRLDEKWFWISVT
ncbi:hypothetical protein [Paenibacillus fonticola]|uniref:hypothetical protein n=1 Tax=Paenibacillus fonticola TaxID=379896 RepID=UPI00035F145B|nr:hypothetical protein [Paenibacillus fonticola]